MQLALSGGAFHDCEPRLHDFSRPCLASSFQRCISFLHQLSTGDYFQFDFLFSLAARFSASSTRSRRLAGLASYSFSPRPRVSSALAEGTLIIKFPSAHRYPPLP
eukprot:g40435.t1